MEYYSEKVWTWRSSWFKFSVGHNFYFFLLSQILVGFKMYQGAESLFFQLLFLDTVLLIIWLRVILQLSGKLERFRQSLTALFGTGTLFNFILSPFMLFLCALFRTVNLFWWITNCCWITSTCVVGCGYTNYCDLVCLGNGAHFLQGNFKK